MELLIAGGFVVLGLIVLVIAGDLLVRGAVNLALRAGVSALLVSLTVVAFGTSAPELLVSIQAVLGGKPGLAVGNVVGSNIANILLVLGVPALISGLRVSRMDTRRSYLVMIATTILFAGMALAGPLTWVHGVILLGALSLTLLDQGRQMRRHRRAAPGPESLEGADPRMRMWRILTYLLIGLIGLPVGAQLLVDNASILARSMGVSDAVIGLTLVALGTSLPELATSVAAAIRRQAEVAIGNVIGSNIFNLLAILGATTFFGTIPVDQEILNFDLWVMLGTAALLGGFVLARRDIGRVWGIALSAGYLVYVGLVLI